MHTFEMSGMGLAPFKYHSQKPKNLTALPACEHCGRTITNIHYVISSDGIISMVGVDCLRKTGDIGLTEGLTRHLRTLRSQQRMSIADANRVERESIERNANNGKTLEELRNEKNLLHIKEQKRILDEINELVHENELLNHCMTIGNFGTAMINNVLEIKPLSKGMISALVKIEAKRISNARANSKAFKDSIPLARNNVTLISSKIQKHHDYLLTLKY